MWLRYLSLTVPDGFQPTTCKLLIKLVAGAGFEPATFGL